MQEPVDLIEQLNLSGEALTRSYQLIADFISLHYEKAVFMTATALAKSCGISESTVIRFSMKLGYSGYPELREAMSRLVRQRLTSQQRFEIASDIDPTSLLETVLHNDAQNIRRTMDSLNQNDFDNVVTRLLTARRVYVLGLRSAAPLAQFMYLYLHQILDEVVFVNNILGDVFEEIATISANDVLIGISFPRYSTRTLECMRFAKDCGAQIVALTDSEVSPLHEVADICLCAATDMASFVDSLAAPMSVINALIVSIGLHRREQLAEHFKQLEGIWNAHGIYINKKDK